MIIINNFVKIPAFLVSIVFLFCMMGCHTARPMQSSEESREDVGGALSAVAGALTGKTLTEEELKNLENQIRTDEEAQSAIKSITDSMGANTVSVKYCPITGKRYSPHLEVCPEHQVELKAVGQ